MFVVTKTNIHLYMYLYTLIILPHLYVIHPGPHARSLYTKSFILPKCRKLARYFSGPTSPKHYDLLHNTGWTSRFQPRNDISQQTNKSKRKKKAVKGFVSLEGLDAPLTTLTLRGKLGEEREEGGRGGETGRESERGRERDELYVIRTLNLSIPIRMHERMKQSIICL